MPNARVTISRNNFDEVYLEVIDEKSKIQFLSVKFSLEDYARIVTGCGQITGEAEYRGLQNVGKTKIVEERTAEMPGRGHSRKECTEWLEKYAQEEGWIVDSYLGSQDSISFRENTKALTTHLTLLRYRVYKFEN